MPLYLEAHIQLVNIFRRMGQLELAISQALESSKMFSRSPVILTVLAGLYIEKGDYQRSKEYLNSAKGEHPNDVLVLVLLGILNFRTAPRKTLLIMRKRYF